MCVCALGACRWDWNVGPSSCSTGDFNEAVSFVNGHVEMRADSKATVRRCWSVWDFPVGGLEVQYWAKPLEGGAAALLVINTNSTHPKQVSVALSTLMGAGGGKKPVKVRDVWEHTDNGTVAGGAFTATVPPADSVFVRLTPA